MNNIRIVNLRNYKLNPDEELIKVDRSSSLGNPYHMQFEGQRDEVCDKYYEYFYEHIRGTKRKEGFIGTLNNILELSKHKDIALGCWCYPKRCHAETIKEYIEKKSKETF